MVAALVDVIWSGERVWVGKEMTAHFSFPKEMRCQACIKFLVFGVRGCPVT